MGQRDCVGAGRGECCGEHGASGHVGDGEAAGSGDSEVQDALRVNADGCAVSLDVGYARR